jgi:serine/threonine protein kinase
MKASRPSRLDPVQPGTQFAGKYEVIASMRQSPENAAYKVRDLATGEVLVLRLCGTDGAGGVPELRRSLLVERSFSHENVERIYAVGEHAGSPFVVCEYTGGRELAEILSERGALPAPEFLRLFRQICTGLAYIHSTRAVHGDLCSSNILVSDSGSVKLAGAGLGKGPASAAGDVRAAGAVFLEMLGGTKHSEIPPYITAIIGKCVDSRGGFRDGVELLEAASRLAAPPHASRPRRTLAEFAAEEPADVNEVVPLFLRIVERLRDSKPGGLGLSPRNVHVAPDGGIDIQAGPAAGLQHTVTTEPKYCPPEMFREAPPEAGELADIYVLGFIMYEILLGRRLFRLQFEDLDPEPDAFQWMRWHADTQKALPPLPELISNFPRPLAELVRGMTEKDPARRIATLAAVREGLGSIRTRVLDTQIPIAPPVDRTRRRPARSRAKTGALTAVPCVIAAAAAWFMWPARPSPATGYPAAVDTPTGRMVLVSPNGATAFYLDEYEITNWQYRKFCDGRQRPCPAATAPPEYPVRGISREDFIAYAIWAGKRPLSPGELAAAAPRFDRRRHPWQPEADGQAEFAKPHGASAADRRHSVLGFRCAADPPEALKLASPRPWWRRLWPVNRGE